MTIELGTVCLVVKNKRIDLSGRQILQYGEEIFLDTCRNTLHFHLPDIITINLNEKQKRLWLCLLDGIYHKQDVIKVVWYENYQSVVDNSYHQLIHKARVLLIEHGLPGCLIKTVNRYGLRLNVSLLQTFCSKKEMATLDERADALSIANNKLRQEDQLTQPC